MPARVYPEHSRRTGMTKLRFVFDSVGRERVSQFTDADSRPLLSRREWNSKETRRIACVDGLPVGDAKI